MIRKQRATPGGQAGKRSREHSTWNVAEDAITARREEEAKTIFRDSKNATHVRSFYNLDEQKLEQFAAGSSIWAGRLKFWKRVRNLLVEQLSVKQMTWLEDIILKMKHETPPPPVKRYTPEELAAKYGPRQ